MKITAIETIQVAEYSNLVWVERRATRCVSVDRAAGISGAAAWL